MREAQRPPNLSDLSRGAKEGGSRQPAAPKSPLSRLVDEGYPQGPPTQATSHQPYGDRPSSGSGVGRQCPQPRSSNCTPGGIGNLGGGAPAPLAGGFDANIAGQWNSNVQQNVHSRQNRHDPSVAGPHITQGGQRVTQAPGGCSSIDLSWGGGGGAPPRMPGSGSPQGAAPCHGHGGQNAYDNRNSHPQRGMSPARGQGAAPWGRDDNYTSAPQSRRSQAAPPFGVDSGGSQFASNAVHSRGKPPSGGGAPNSFAHGGAAPGGGMYSQPDMMAAGGQRGRGSLGGRTPGGSSQIVFG